ncbi:MAG: PQQ-binding-like beta-propeller repeat protein [Saprospiraceae bacterium]|nr:PQQ-binding-like beta-propeller repeat protein [Saprospiraceae bacterium]
MRTIIFFVSIIFTLTGCSKTEQPDNTTPKLLWKVPLLNGKESFSFNPVIYKEWVIYGVKYARLDHFEKPKVAAFNKTTGAKIWEWSDAKSDTETYSGFDDTYTYQNTLVISTRLHVYAIDMNTGKSLWTTKAVYSGSPSIVGVGEKFTT